MAYLGLDAKKLLQNVANSQVLSGQPQLTPQDQAKQNEQQNQAVPPQNTVGMISSDQSTTPQQQTANKGVPSSGSFTNLQNYVQKNQAGSNQLAGAVGQNLQTAAERAKTNIAQTQQKFGTELEAGSLQGRDTAVQEALKVAQTAAGGIQEQKTQEDLQAKYKQPIESIQNTLQSNNQKLADLQAAQKQYNAYSAAAPQYDKISNYLDKYSGNISGAWNAGNINPVFGASNMLKVNAAIKQMVTPIINQRYDINNKIAAYLKTDEAKQKLAKALGVDTSYYNDWKSGAGTAAPANSDNMLIQGISAAPKYSDRSKDIAATQSQLQKQQQDLELYQGLAKLQPTPEQIPDILKNASTFGGDVSEERFKDIINAAYKGPGNLYDIKGYEDALANTREAERRMGLVNDRGIDSNLLDTVFKGKGRDYTSGERGLDQLLLGTPDKLQQLQETKKNIGSVQDILTKAETGAKLNAQERTDLINSIKGQARGEVQQTAEARNKQVEDRLSGVVKNWDKLPQYFRNALVKKASDGTTKLSDVEAAMLGVSSGEGLYNTIRDQGINNVIKTTTANKEALVSKAEQSQLANLQKLAEMADTYNQQGNDLNYKSGYQNADIAGTQTAYDALDAQHLRDVLNEAETGFRGAANTNIAGTGVGHDRYKSGFRSHDVWIRKNLSANLKDVLQKSGYDFNKPLNQQTANPELIKALGAATRGEDVDISEVPNLKSVTQAALIGAPGGITDSLMDSFGLGKYSPGALAAKGVNIAKSGLNTLNNIPIVNNPILNPALFGANAVANLAGNFFGSGKGHAQDTATRNATNAAIQNLQGNLTNKLNTLGFNNRIAVDSEDPAVRARRLQLAQTLAGIDATNTKNADNQLVENPFDQDILQFAKRINQGYRRT